jgi:metal-sulfur cluster biosynthetic enzyme
MSEGEVWEALSQVIDPELGIDIVELGLVYGVEMGPEGIGITMTLTTPGCPLHDAMVEAVERALARTGGSPVDVRVVWDPPWTPDRIGAAGRAFLGGPRPAA